MRWYLRFSLPFCLALALAAPATAGETGSISGVVKDAQGGVLPGATVKVSGAHLPGGRESLTGANGDYLFPRLLPGIYKVEASLSGMGVAAREVRVYVDVDAQVELTLSPTLAETVTVSAEAPAVDLKNAEVNFNYTSETIKDLPLARSYRGLFQLIPGVADNNSTAGVSALGPSAGGSRQDNTYLMDGVNITNPGFGTLTTEINELDIAEFNIKRGAITAEFGRAAGFVANAVSKSGTNRFGGAARVQWQPKSFAAKPDDPAFGFPRTEFANPAVSVGGPLVRDRLFWYGSAQYYRRETPDRVNKFSTALPDRVNSGEEYYGKITATPTPRHLATASFRHRPSATEGAFPGGAANSAPSVATKDDTTAQVATASWAFFPTDRTVIDVKYLFLKDNNTGDPVTDLGFLAAGHNLPFTLNISNLTAMGQFTDPNQANLLVGGNEFTNRQNYKRHEVKAVFSQYLDIGKTGHQLKVGGGYEFGQEELNRLGNGWGQISLITVSGQPVYRARYYFEQPPQLGQGRTWSFFVQDTMTVSSRLTLNLGLLLNRDEFAQDLPGSGGCPVPVNTLSGQPGGTAVFESSGGRCTFIRYGFFDQVQPRLGFNFGVRPGAGDKLYANWGRYYNTDQKSSARSLAPRRIYQREARFNATTGALISDLPRASTTGKQIDPDLKPTYNDEFLAGYATPLGSEWSVDAFFLYRNTENFIEDVPSVLLASGNPNFSFPYAAANLPCDLYASCRNADAQRSYKAFTLEISRRLAKRWSANLSYTWSRLEGNFDLDYTLDTAVFNTSSFIQDGPGTNVEEAGRLGPLRQDRPHVFKLFANVTPIDSLMLGGYLRVQSGAPWNARGQDTQGGSALYYLEPAGTHRNPTWANFDLLASYRFKLSDRANLTFEARVLNLFDTQTRILTDSVRFTNTVVTATPPGIAPGTILNPFFGTGSQFAQPRRILLAALVNF